MHVTVTHPDGSQTAYFGLNDFQEREDSVYLVFHSDVPMSEENRYVIRPGTVTSAFTEANYNTSGAIERIGDLAVGDDMEVIVGAVPIWEQTAEAARTLLEEAEPEVAGSITLFD